MDKNYCYGFLYLGNAMKDSGWQKKFIQRAQETVPESMLVKRAVSHLIDLN
jgi:hypothetical protein